MCNIRRRDFFTTRAPVRNTDCWKRRKSQQPPIHHRAFGVTCVESNVEVLCHLFCFVDDVANKPLDAFGGVRVALSQDAMNKTVSQPQPLARAVVVATHRETSEHGMINGFPGSSRCRRLPSGRRVLRWESCRCRLWRCARAGWYRAWRRYREGAEGSSRRGCRATLCDSV